MDCHLRVAKPQRSFAATQALLEHRRLAHCGHPKLKATAKSNVTLTDLDFHCEPCHIAKAKRQVSHITLPRSKNVWDLIHIDVQLKPVGHGGVKYYLIIVNKHRIPEVDFLHSKDEASDKMIAYHKAFKNLTGHYPVRVRLDGGSEFAKFTTWAKNRVGNTHIGCNCQLLLLRYRIPSNVSIHWTVEYLDWEMEWLSIQVIRETCIPRLAEEEHPNYFSIVRHLRANRRVLVQLLASRFTNNGFDEEVQGN
ncbi:hypothetical protein V8E54_011106 [Elaphomyces granulatus]